jgi:hypothetical protein
MDSRKKILNLNLNTSFSFSNFASFLIAAFALQVGLISKWIGIIFAQIEDESFVSFKGYESLGHCHEFEFYVHVYTYIYTDVYMFMICFKHLACSPPRLHHESLVYTVVSCDSDKQGSERDGSMFQGHKS